MKATVKRETNRSKIVSDWVNKVNWKNTYDYNPDTDSHKTTFVDSNENMEQAVYKHKHKIMYAILYGRANEARDEKTGRIIHHFSGFEQRYGRLPNENDVIVITADIGEPYFDNVSEGKIVSTISWRNLNINTK